MPGKTDLSRLNCSLARALSVLGDWWTLLIVRDVFLGARRFSEFHRSLGIARNILADRLETLVADGILLREGSPARPLYTLTAKGRDMLPALVALTQWGDKWQSDGQAPVLMTDAQGRELPRVRVKDRNGNLVTQENIRFRAGPGANPATQLQFKMRALQLNDHGGRL